MKWLHVLSTRDFITPDRDERDLENLRTLGEILSGQRVHEEARGQFDIGRVAGALAGLKEVSSDYPRFQCSSEEVFACTKEAGAPKMNAIGLGPFGT